MYELSKQFRFDSAHTLEREVTKTQRESSRRVHGHSYRAEVTVRGPLQVDTGMVIDLDALERALDGLHAALDHHMLNEIPDLGLPTMENMCRWIWQRVAAEFPNLARVAVHRDSSGDSCVYHGSLEQGGARKP